MTDPADASKEELMEGIQEGMEKHGKEDIIDSIKKEAKKPAEFSFIVDPVDKLRQVGAFPGEFGDILNEYQPEQCFRCDDVVLVHPDGPGNCPKCGGVDSVSGVDIRSEIDHG